MPGGADFMHFYVVSAYFGVVLQGRKDQKLCIFTWYPHTLALFRKPQEADSMHFYVVSAYFGMVSQGMDWDNLCICMWYPHDLAGQSEVQKIASRSRQNEFQKA